MRPSIKNYNNNKQQKGSRLNRIAQVVVFKVFSFRLYFFQSFYGAEGETWGIVGGRLGIAVGGGQGSKDCRCLFWGG